MGWRNDSGDALLQYFFSIDPFARLPTGNPRKIASTTLLKRQYMHSGSPLSRHNHQSVRGIIGRCNVAGCCQHPGLKRAIRASQRLNRAFQKTIVLFFHEIVSYGPGKQANGGHSGLRWDTLFRTNAIFGKTPTCTRCPQECFPATSLSTDPLIFTKKSPRQFP
ncbi:MAG: hypothetical protein A4E34_00389 [Methanoregula sp. PtaU1.Bin006]|nr:MAG: hypothetical protein A4E33_01558 [Methanoregula sp. PtaB.Bin085]OPY36211.1 MAG: hypothetical protein A4E34_00389 [Methanoregula sp. PtaU1.Bin006]